MVKLKRVVLLMACCLLLLSSCQLGGNQNEADSGDVGEGDVSADEAGQEAADEGDEEIAADTADLIGLVPTCEEGSWISPVDGARIICIPEGNFQMGALDGDEDAEEDEFPLHEQEVSEFWIYETEVTNGMFQKFIEATRYTTTAEINGYSYTNADSEWVMVDGADWQHPQGPDSDISELDDHPVVNVSLDDADAYCLWGNNGYLPTEAQWEKAARGTELNLYPWGDDPVTAELANYAESADSITVNVFDLDLGSSPYGLLHMSGNVAEWISTVYKADYYETGASFTGVETENQVRGGSWLSLANELRVSDRQPISMEIASADSVGFRCVLSSNSENPAYATAGTDTEASGDETEIGASSSACEMTIPAGFKAEIITEGQLDRLQEYAYSGQAGSSDQNQTLLGFWEAEQFGLGIFIPGNQNVVKFKQMPCGTLYLYVIQSDGGVPSYDDWISFEFVTNTVVTTAQDKSAFMFFTGEASAEENEDGSISIDILGAACESSEMEASAEEVVISGSGVDTFELTTLEDGSIELVIYIDLEAYPEAFDAWKETLMGQLSNLLSMSSSINKNGDEVISAFFTVTLPAGAYIMQEGDVLNIYIVP